MKKAYLLSVLIVAAAALIQSCGRDEQSTQSSVFLAQESKSSCLCYPQPARNMGILLLRSNPLIEIDAAQFSAFQSFVQENASLLQTNGPTMTCARQLGQALQYQGLKSYSQQDYNDAYGSVLAKGGTIEMANDVAGSMQSGALDAWMTGKELVWLSQVIPSAAAGNWQPYLTTGTESRNQLRQVIQIYRAMPDMRQMLKEMQPLLASFQPIVEEQMVMAGCLFRK